MTDPAGRSKAGDEAAPEAVRRSVEGTPRWVKVSGIVALLVVVLFVVLLIAGGSHNSGRHSGTGVVQTPLDSA